MKARTFLPATLVLASTLALPMMVQARSYQTAVTPSQASERRAEMEEDIEVVLRTAASLQKTAQAKKSTATGQAATFYSQADRLFAQLLQVAQREDLNRTTTASSIRADEANTGVTTLRRAAKDPVFREEAATLRQLANLFASGTRSFLAAETQVISQPTQEELLNDGTTRPVEEVPPVVVPYPQAQVIEVSPTLSVINSPFGGANVITVGPYGVSSVGAYAPYAALFGNGYWNSGFGGNNGNNYANGSFNYSSTLSVNNGYWFPNGSNPYVQILP